MSGVTFGGSSIILGSNNGTEYTKPVQTTGFWSCISRIVTFITDAIKAPFTWLASIIAKAFFLPLTTQEKQAQLKKEEEFRAQFLKGAPVPPLQNQKILDAYKVPRERSYVVSLKDGRKVTLTCSVWETKPRGGVRAENAPYFNLAYLAGNHATNQSAITGVYSYLHDMLDALDKQNHFHGARAFVITAYNIINENEELHIPDPFQNGGFIHEEGLIIKEVLCAIQEDFQCQIEQLVAHSLGGILCAAAMMHFHEKDQRHIPKNILFDRCPWSIEQAAKNITFGWLIVPIAQCLGVSLDIAEQVDQFYRRHKQYIDENRISFFVVDVKQDHRFGNVQLGVASQIKQLIRERVARRLVFDFAQQLYHEMSHHSMIHSFIYGAYLKEENDENTELFAAFGKRKFLGDRETLSEGIVRHSMAKARKVYYRKMRRRQIV